MKKRSPVVFRNARFTLVSEGCIRMEYANDAAFSPYPSVLTERRKSPARSGDVYIKGRTCRICTRRLELRYEDDGQPFHAGNLSIRHKDQDGQFQCWSPGKEDRGNLGEVSRSLDFWKWCGGPKRYPVEGILSTEGGHYLPDTARVYWNSHYDWPQAMDKQVQHDGWFFAYGRDYAAALQDFITVFGPVPMVPRWTFGLWYSRWYAYRDQHLLDLVDRYDREGIPFDVMIIDTDWRGGWGGYDWSSRFFPKPDSTLQALKDKQVMTCLNDHPGYDDYESLPEDDSHVPVIKQELGPLPYNGRWCCDWSNRRAVEVWKKHVLGPFFDQGMDFWWIDGWIKSPFPGTDSQLWANQHYYELAEEKTGKRGMILSRWGGPGSHRYPVQFSGDTPSEWHMLREQVDFTVRSCGLGAVYWSHDIGGFFEDKLDEELYIRWFQFGSLSPVFRTHSDHGTREPWKYSARLKKLFKKQTRIRYALAPYFYHLSRETHLTGMPLLRPLYLHYNDNDGGALQRRQQYLLGEQLLVIPVTDPADSNGRSIKRAYFPNGIWHELETEQTVYGMHDGRIDAPLERIPMYVRQGSIIPCQTPGQRMGVTPPEEIEFDIYPDPDSTARFELYEDDGESTAFRDGAYELTTVSCRMLKTGLDVRIKTRGGQYRGWTKDRGYVCSILLSPEQRVSSVELGTAENVRPVAFKHTQQFLGGVLRSPRTYCTFRVGRSDLPAKLRVKYA